MPMQYNRYFQEELSALRELGKEFSEQNPRLAPFLSVEGQDPDVERLLEGFAFLSGRIRQKLDDDLPEFAWSLIKLIWPHFLQTIPSITTVQMNPLDILSEKQRLVKGAEIKSKTVDGTPCIFKTAFDVDLNPMRVQSVNVKEENGVSKICLSLQLFQSASLKDIKFDDLRFHLQGAFTKTSLWYYLLREHVSSIDVWAENEGKRLKVGSLPTASIKPAGLSADVNLFPAVKQQFSGHRLLFEYFCYPEKFLYIDVLGLESLFLSMPGTSAAHFESIHIEFVLDRILPLADYPTDDNIRLYCSPAINQFQVSSRPFLLDRRRAEHRLRVEAPSPDHYEILNVDKLEGWSPETRRVTEYPLFESYSVNNTDSSKAQKTFWSQQRPSIVGKGLETYISFVSVATPKPMSKVVSKPGAKAINGAAQAETISGKVTCSNRHLPARLGVGDICVETSTIPEYLDCKNISAVTPSYSPATKINWIWRLISLSALNIHKVLDLASLKSLITHMDVRGLFDKQQQAATRLKVEGLESLSIIPVMRLFKGMPVRGSDVRLTVSSDKFSGMGDVFLFGEILNEFFSLSAPVNSFQRLSIKTVPEGEVIHWCARVGEQAV
jgi:type VI secretion system protein ImpG